MLKKIFLFVCFYVLVHASDYYPLAVGNYWVYTHNTYTSDGNASTTFDSTVITGETSFQDMQMFTVKSYTGLSLDSLTGKPHFFITSRDNRIYQFVDTTDFDTVYYWAKRAYTDGEKWDNGIGGLEVKFLNAPVAVEAGVFDSCFHVFYEFCLAETYFERIYAPDVGMVYARRNWGDYIITLMRYNVSSTSISKNVAPVKHSEKPCLYTRTLGSYSILSVPSKYRITSINIYDMGGMCINSFSDITDNRAYWNIKRVPSGAYIVHALGNGTIIDQMITVRH